MISRLRAPTGCVIDHLILLVCLEIFEYHLPAKYEFCAILQWQNKAGFSETARLVALEEVEIEEFRSSYGIFLLVSRLRCAHQRRGRGRAAQLRCTVKAAHLAASLGPALFASGWVSTGLSLAAQTRGKLRSWPRAVPHPAPECGDFQICLKRRSQVNH